MSSFSPTPAGPADFRAAAAHAAAFHSSLGTRRIGVTATVAELRRALDRPLPEDGLPADRVVSELVADVAAGLVSGGSSRFFGFVASGTTGASLQADWLTSVWDQNAQVFALSPAAAVVEEVAARWLLELLGLPAEASVGFVTGGQMANFTALTVARNTVLERAGWNVDEHGLCGAPPPQFSSANVSTALYSPPCGCWAWARRKFGESRRTRRGAWISPCWQRACAKRPDSR